MWNVGKSKRWWNWRTM